MHGRLKMKGWGHGGSPMDTLSVQVVELLESLISIGVQFPDVQRTIRSFKESSYVVRYEHACSTSAFRFGRRDNKALNPFCTHKTSWL